jgi:hypothetical protein
MREIRLYGSEGGGAARSPYPYQLLLDGWLDSRFRGNDKQGNSLSPIWLWFEAVACFRLRRASSSRFQAPNCRR